jgi:hypothetical protein
MTRSGYYIGEIAPVVPATVTSPIPIPSGYMLVPAAVPPPITAATGGLNVDWKGDPIKNPDRRRDPLVPVVEINHSGQVGDPLFVPLHSLDSMVGELSDMFDFGLGEFYVENPHELGRLKARAKARPAPRRPAPRPKVSVSVAKGTYKPLRPPTKPTTKAPIRAAVKKVQAQKKKPIVVARKKPSEATSAKTLASVYAALKKQNKLLDLLAVKQAVTSESNKKLQDQDFKDNLTGLLKKIDTQVAGDASGNYFARWNKLKKITGVSGHGK